MTAAGRSASSVNSGCGKSVLSLSVMRLVPAARPHRRGTDHVRRQDLLDLSPAQMRDVRGNRIAMIFQEPMTSLNPVFTVGVQITEAMRAHEPHRVRSALRSRAIDAACSASRIPAPGAGFDEYPAPAVRRHAPARDDRHGAAVRSATC